MALVIRQFADADALKFVEVHRSAVRETAARDYPDAVIASWAPAVTPSRVARMISDRSGARIVAVQDGEIVGIGEVEAVSGEIRACYVLPAFGRRGIGRAIMIELERIARKGGASALGLKSSLTAETFYRRLGFVVERRCDHLLRDGVAMACVVMSKSL